MLARSLKLPLALALGVLALAACDEAPLASGSTPRLAVLLSDAPADLAEANVRIEKVVLIRDESGEGSAGGRVELTPKSTDWIDLLTLANGKVQDLVTETIEAGTYRQLRLVVCDMYIRTRAGQVVATPGTTLPAGVSAAPGTELKLNSQCRSGFKVGFAENGVTVGEGTNTVVIDFDVQRSFVREAGRSGKWIVAPVLHGIREETGGGIGGTVALQGVALPVSCGGESLTQSALLQRFVPTATAGSAVRSGSTRATGSYGISHLAPGAYTLGADSVVFADGSRLRFTAAPNPATATVTAGASATSNFTVSAVSCTAA